MSAGIGFVSQHRRVLMKRYPELDEPRSCADFFLPVARQRYAGKVAGVNVTGRELTIRHREPAAASYQIEACARRIGIGDSLG